MSRGAGLVRRRAVAQRMLLAAAVGVMLPALVLMTLIRMHASVAEREGVRHALAGLPKAQQRVTLRFSADTEWHADSREQDEPEMVRQAAAAFVGISAAVSHSTSTVEYNVTGAQTANSVYFWSADGVANNATLVAGAWPGAAAAGATAGTVFDAAVTKGAADANHWQVGDVVQVEPRIGAAKQTFRVSGIYTIPANAESSGSGYWWDLDPLRGAGHETEDQPVYGPVVVDRSVTAGALLNIKAAAVVVDPDFSTAAPDAAARLVDRLRTLEDFVAGSAAPSVNAVITDDLRKPAAGIEADRAISARLVLLPVIELALLAFTAMILTTRLLSEHRRESDGLLRARGASVLGMAKVGLTEGMALALPLALVAPFAARALLGRLSEAGSSGGKADQVSITPDLWAVAVGGAVLTAVMLAVAGVRSAASFTEAKRLRSRSTARTVVQRSGADAMVAVLGLGALWELGQYGGGSAHAGSLGWPLIIAPSVLLLAGSLLALRLLPLLIGVLDKIATRRRGAVSALAGWRVGRTARTYAAPMILLIMAVAVGVQAVVFVASADRSAVDQSAFDTGADARVTGLPVTGLGLAGRLAGAPGSAAGFAAMRSSAAFESGSAATQTSVLGIDPERSRAVVALRPDLSSKTWPQLAAALGSSGWDASGQAGGVPVPGEPAKLSLDVQFTSASAPSGLAPVDVTAQITDAYGLVETVDFGTAPPDGTAHTLTAALDAQGGTIAYPVRVSALTAVYGAPNCPVTVDDQGHSVYGGGARCKPSGDSPPPASEHATLQLGKLAADGTPVAMPATTTPEPAASAASAPTVGSGVATSGTQVVPGSGTSIVALDEDSGFGVGQSPVVSHVLLMAPKDGFPKTVPAIATDALLKSLGLHVGDTLQTNGFGPPALVRFVGSVQQLPGTAGSADAIVVPIGYLQQLAVRTGSASGTVDWWAAGGPGTAPSQLAAALAEVPSRVRPAVVDRQTEAGVIRHDPMRGGVRLTLIIAALAALLFILIGFAVHSVIAVRERAAELALLHALGLSKRRTAVMLIAEQALIVLLGTAAGGVLAVVTVRAVLPLTILTDTGATPVPKPDLLYDLPLLGSVGVAALLFLLLTVGVMVAVQRREGIARALRMGEDR